MTTTRKLSIWTDEDENPLIQEGLYITLSPGGKKHIHRPSRWLSFNGHSPLFLAGRVKRVSTMSLA